MVVIVRIAACRPPFAGSELQRRDVKSDTLKNIGLGLKNLGFRTKIETIEDAPTVGNGAELPEPIDETEASAASMVVGFGSCQSSTAPRRPYRVPIKLALGSTGT